MNVELENLLLVDELYLTLDAYDRWATSLEKRGFTRVDVRWNRGRGADLLSYARWENGVFRADFRIVKGGAR